MTFNPRKVTFLLVQPLGCLFAFCMWLYSRFVFYEKFNWDDIPENAILYSSHTEVYYSCWNPQFHHGKGNPVFTIGFYGITPYLWVPWHALVGISWEAYSRSIDQKPIEQIVGFLERRSSERLMIFTDSGGPYGKIRDSLIELSRSSERPLIAFRHHCKYSFTIWHHKIPLPFSRLKVGFSEPVSIEKLAESTDPLRTLQQNFDDLNS